MDDSARILVVDDEPHLRRATARLLTGAGHEVVEAASGIDGLRLARQEKPDLVLLDVVLPDLDGLEICRRIKADADLAATHVVLLSAYRTTSDNQADGLEAGADAFIARPTSSRELLARVEAALRLKRAEDTLRERTRELSERIKELNCLYGISQLREQPDLSLDEILQRTADLIPLAWQRPESTGARIVLAGKAFQTSNFKETAWRQACDIQVWGTPAGWVEVYHLEERLQMDEGPFLAEERKLLNAIAERLGRVVERMQMEAALQQAEERYRAVSELTSDLAYAFRVEPDGSLTREWVTEALRHLTGYTSEELESRGGWGTVIHREDVDASQHHIQALLSGMHHVYELRIITKDGQVRWLHDSGRPVWDEAQGRVIRIYGAAQDITERKKAEEAQRQSERELRIRNQINSIFLTYPDDEMYAQVLQLILETMESEYGTFGYFDEHGSFVAPALTRQIYWQKCDVPEKEIIFEKGTFGGIWGRAIQERSTMIANEGPFSIPEGHIRIQNTMVTPIIFKDKVISAIHLANKPDGYDEQDRAMVEMIAGKIAPVLYARLQRDRRETERKRAEDALRQSEERYRLLLESSSDGVYVLDPEWRYIVANDAAARSVQLSKEALLGNKLTDLFRGIEETVFFQTFQRVMETREAGSVAAEYTHPDGRKRWYEVHVDSVPEGILCISRDITDRKEAEKAQAETSQLLETILDHTHILVAYLDPQFNFIRVNRAYAEADEREPSFFPGKNHFDLFPHAENEKIFHRVLETGQPYHVFAKPFEYAEHPERKVSYWDWSLVPTKDREGTVAGLVLTLANITERVQAQQALWESEQRYRSLFEQTLIGVVNSGADGRISAVNPAVVKILGYDHAGELLGQTAETIWFAPEDRSRAIRVITDLGYLPVQEVRLRKKDGTLLHGLATATIDRDRDGGFLGIMATFTDISDRKRAEEDLQWEFNVDAALSALYAPVISPRSSIEEIANIVLDKARGLTGSAHGYGSAIDAVTGDNVCYTLTEMLKGECQVSGESRCIAFPRGSDGHYPGLWGHSLNTREAFFTNTPQTHPACQGIPDRHVPIHNFLSVPVMLGEELVGQIALGNKDGHYEERDLEAIRRMGEFYALAIQRKRAEAALRESEEKYRDLVENINDVIYELNVDGVLTYISPAVESLIGYSASEVVGQHFLKFIDPRDGQRIQQRFQQIMSGDAPGPGEYRIVTKPGVTRWMRVSSQPRVEDGGVAGVRGLLTDVTEQVEAQQQLQAAVAEKETLLKEIHHRVKNNLQLISAMLDLQARATEDEQVSRAFEESQHRILSMAGIHEQLYGSKDLSQVDMAAYVQDLAAELEHSYGRPAITIRAEAAKVSLDIDRAIPCGLIINELVSNALKHAFPLAEEEVGEVRIRLQPLRGAGGGIELTVSDNGVGLPVDLDPEQSGTLGLTMVSLLARQLKGSLEVDRNHGTLFRVTFGA